MKKTKKLLSVILSLMMVITAVCAIPFSAQATSKPQGWVKTAVDDIKSGTTVMVTMDTNGDGKGDWVLPNAQAQTPEATAFSTTLSKNDYGFKFSIWQGTYSFASSAESSSYAAITSDSNTGFTVKKWEITDFSYTTINGHNYFIDHDTSHSNGNTDRCFGVYVPAEGTPTWRCYKSTNLSNIANQDVVLYVWGDLPDETPSNQFTLIFDANGGKKGPKWQDRITKDGQLVSYTCVDIAGYEDEYLAPPAGKVLDAYLINGTRCEIGTVYKPTTNVLKIKFLWKDAGDIAPAPVVAPAKNDKITNAEKRAAKNKINSKVKATANKDGSITLKWGKYAKAERIVIYAGYCTKGGKYKKIKTVKGNVTSYKLTKLGGKKLNPNKAVKAYVVAYRKVNGKYKKLAQSYTLHLTGYKNKKYSNAKSIKVKKAAFTLNVKKTAKIKPALTLEKKGKKAVTHVAKFRYMSTNPAVATVDKNGKITAKKKGKCSVYIFANNGMLKTVKVTVK